MSEINQEQNDLDISENNQVDILNENQNQEDNFDKLNLNTKKLDSSRERMIPKEEKTDEKVTKDNIEKTIEKDISEKKEEKEGIIETQKEKEGENMEQTPEEKKEEKIGEKKEEKIEEKKDDEKDKKSEDELKTLQKKIKLPIIPYKVSDSYQQELLTVLKKNDHSRPKSVLAPEMGDITRSIDDLEKDELKQLKIEELEHNNLDNKERDDKIHLDKYKESSFKGETVIQDPFALFYNAETCYIDQFYKLSDLFVICPLYMNYRISLEYCIGDSEGKKEYAAYHLFNTKETSPPCSHDCCANQAREIDINIFNLVLEPKEKTRKIQKFVTIKKGCRCAFSCFCACCSRPTFSVDTPSENLGKIIEERTVCDPILKIADINNDIIYNISTRGSDCAYCCRDQCCDSRRCASCEFLIYDGAMEKTIGVIKKDHKSGKKMMPDYDQLKIVFPPGISCQDKILLVSGTLALEYLYFQNFSNSKRCRGAPRFLNAYSD